MPFIQTTRYGKKNDVGNYLTLKETGNTLRLVTHLKIHCIRVLTLRELRILDQVG